MTEEKLSKIYDILILIGASEEDKRDFIHNHLNVKYPCTEWRFMGCLGWGGKYRITSNSVDCYKEDLTPIREIIIKLTNFTLGLL